MDLKLSMGPHEMEMGGKYLTTLKESNDILDDTNALRARMQEDGYLFIRGLHDPEQVIRAKNEYLTKMDAIGRLAPGTTLEEGIIGPENKGTMYQGLNLDMPELLSVVNSSKIMNFFDRFLGGETLTYDFKWARAIGNSSFTGAHYDIVYMGRGTKNLYTTWTPLGDVDYETGGLALCLGSQHFDKIKQTYGEMDVDRDNVTGWFSENPIEIADQFGGKWATASFKAGDALIFGMYMMHASFSNQTNRYRISVDTRYQLASEPVDERWFGQNKGHYAWGKGKTVSMEEARTKWGV